MASVYRRKQDSILGLDNSSFISTSSSLAHAVARYRTDSESLRGETDSISDKSVSRMESSRDYARSLYERDTNIDEDYVVSDLEESDDDGKTRTGIPEKANRILGLNSAREQQLRCNSITAKAQKILGKSKQQLESLHFDPFQHQSPPVDAEHIAPKALRTLGIQSRSLSRPMTTHQENSPQQTSAGVPFDPDDFKRSLVSSQRPVHMDNGSSTDASSVSRESTISWRTETPRSSQEVHLEDLRWKNRPSVFSQRTDSLFVDPNAVLTEPFSPMSADSPYNKPLPEAPGNFSFELPGDLPLPPPYAADKPHFIAELSAEPETEPIYEMPAFEPEIAELPAEIIDTHGVEKSAGLGIEHPRFPELYSHSPPKEMHTKVVGELSPLKTCRSLPRISTMPLNQVGELPVTQSSGVDAMSSDLVHPLFRRPAVPGIQTGNGDGLMRARSSEAIGRLRRDKMTKSKSAEFALSEPIIESPLSPQSPSAGLGMIAAKAATAIATQRRASPTSHIRGLAARSKYNPETLASKSSSSRGSHSSLRDQMLADRDTDDTTSKVEPVVVQVVPVEDFPESPVTGYIAGHPAFNKSYSNSTKEVVLDPKEILAKLDFPKTREEVASSQPITFSEKEGFI